jgi:hypothetical protein
MIETVSAIHRVLARGSSFPSIVETAPGTLRVMKLSGAGPGRRALATEYLALELARRLGLNVPDAMVLQLPRELPWQAGTDEFYEAVQRSAGSNLGIELIAGATDLEAADLPSLSEDLLARLAAVDALFQNFDRTEANPNLVRDGTGAIWAIDFGACLLIDRLARGVLQPMPELPSNHFLARRAGLSAGARAIAAELDGECLQPLVAELPQAWLEELQLPQTVLVERLSSYFEALRRA